MDPTPPRRCHLNGDHALTPRKPAIPIIRYF